MKKASDSQAHGAMGKNGREKESQEIRLEVLAIAFGSTRDDDQFIREMFEIAAHPPYCSILAAIIGVQGKLEKAAGTGR
jgi:hypothetical protein